MKKLAAWIGGGARVAITGLSLERLLAKLADVLPLFDIVREKHDRLLFSVKAQDLQKLFAITRETCYNITVVKTWGLLPALSRCKKRLGLFLCGGVAAAALVAFSFFIWKVDISASEGFDRAALRDYLAEKGVKSGVSVFSVSEDEIERAVYLHFPDAAFVSCVRHGVSFRVNVVKSLTDVVTAPKEGEDVAASHAGVISRVIVESGTALVRPGERVEVGTPLIGAYREGNGERVPCAALGEVYVIQNVEYSEAVELKKPIRARTGRYVDEKAMIFFGSRFPMKGGKNEFADFDVQRFSYYAFQNNLLPIRVEVTRYFEVIATFEDINFEQGKNIYYEYALLNAKAAIEGRYEVVNEIVEDRREGNAQVIEVLLQIERRAG